MLLTSGIVRMGSSRCPYCLQEIKNKVGSFWYKLLQLQESTEYPECHLLNIMEHGLFGNGTFSELYSHLYPEGHDFHNEEFCTEDNINQCLAYVSQELIALGYPSIYNDTSSCPYAVNCDIIKFVNVTHDLLQKNRQCMQIKEELEFRNQRLSTDLNVLQKKLNQTKCSLEQSERKCSGVLEQERQIKEKCEQMRHQLKREKDEVKKLLSSSQHQKLAFHHEIRKLETEVNQMKVKMNQLLVEKNSDKKFASLSSSYMLQRNDGQRGKWKTGTVPNSRLEEMFTSVIADQENRCKEIAKDMKDCCSCLRYVKDEILDIISISKKCGFAKENIEPSSSWNRVSDEHLYTMFKIAGKNLKEDFRENFEVLRTIVADIPQQQDFKNDVNSNEAPDCQHSGEISLKKCCLKVIKRNQGIVSRDEAILNQTHIQDEECKDNVSASNLEMHRVQWQTEKDKIDIEKASLFEAASSLQKEKEAVVAQKLGLIKLEMKNLQNKACSSPEQGVVFMPAAAVISIGCGSTTDHRPESFDPVTAAPSRSALPSWLQKEKAPKNRWISKSENHLTVAHVPKLGISEKLSSRSEGLVMPATVSLPSWATDSQLFVGPGFENDNVGAKEINDPELSDSHHESSVEEGSTESGTLKSSLSDKQNFDKLKAAAEDMERRHHSQQQ